MKATDARVIAFAQALIGGKSTERISQDVQVSYDADAWVYIAQQASVALCSIACSLLATYIYEYAKSRKGKVRIQDIVTREVRDGMVVYQRAIDKLAEHRSSDPEVQELLDIYVLDGRRVVRMLENAHLDDINLLTLLEEYRGMTESEIKKRADQHYPGNVHSDGEDGLISGCN